MAATSSALGQHRLAGERGVREWTPEGLNDGGAIFEQPCRRRSVTEPGGEMVSSEAERLGASGERRWQHPEHAAAHEPDEAESTQTRSQSRDFGKGQRPEGVTVEAALWSRQPTEPKLPTTKA